MDPHSHLASTVLRILSQHGGRMMADELIDACRCELDAAAPGRSDLVRQLENEVNGLIQTKRLGHRTAPSDPGRPHLIKEVWMRES